MNQLFATAIEFFPDLSLAIVILTLSLRFALSPLQLMSARAAKKMKEIQPDLSLIKEKWKGDTKRIQEETMKLFRQKSINPMAAFVPVLLQLPLFYVFYNLLTTFPGIVGTTLALPDPFFTLPILAGVLQFAQMHRGSENEAGGIVGQKMKTIIPVVFTAIMIKLPLAVLIYTITSSVYSIVEKEVMNRFLV